ncbi:Uncharacterised protein [Mycobacteroides abscessus subsp. abscessus]|nr:Uncharacterised protein [Mycobacteroides abscessus subsp. abscessus]SIF02785.1 Uncharacterised protein [Mycobacteroides abscessus subsp. abscessus]
MVAGEQIDIHSDTAHDLQRLADDARCQLIGFEDITAHHHEVTTLRHSNFAKGGNSLSTRGRVLRLSLTGKEMPCHTQLPVSGVQELHERKSMTADRQPRGRRACLPAPDTGVYPQVWHLPGARRTAPLRYESCRMTPSAP